MLVEQYFAQLEAIIADYGSIRSKVVQKDKRSEYLGYFKAELYFPDGSALYVREFVLTRSEIEKYTYVYHYQTADHQLVFRYDDTQHYPDLPNFPHHKHTLDQVVSAVEPSLRFVLDEILDILS
jgi:hypothetical protein